MTTIGSTGGGTPASQRTATMTPARQPEDVRLMGRALDRARTHQTGKGLAAGEGKARLGVPLGKGARTAGEARLDGKPALAGRERKGQEKAGTAAHPPLDHHVETGLEGDPLRAELAGAEGREGRHAAAEGDSDSGQQQANPLLAATAQAPVQPVAVPDMPAPHVDPAQFAQLMTQLWLRERGKGTKEVRVSFGPDAWPATGARLVRNAAGALDVQLHVGDGGVAYGSDLLDGLSRQLGERGLAIGAVQLAEGAVA